MATYYRKGDSFVVAYRLKGGKRQYLCGIKTEKLARQTRTLKEKEEQLAAAGLYHPDARADQLSRAKSVLISTLIDDFQQAIISRNSTPAHARQQASHVSRLMKLAGIKTLADLRLHAIQSALYKLRGPKCGAATCNHARQAVIAFENWLFRSDMLDARVLNRLTRFNEQEDIRRARRAFTQEEINWLLKTTRSLRDATSRRCGIPPADRAVLYAVGLATGFRQRSLLSLTKASFNVAPRVERPTIRLSAEYNKNHRERIQAIPRPLANLLHRWLTDKPDGRVWKPRPHADLALRFRRDLEATRKAWLAEAANPSERKRREASNILQYKCHDEEKDVFADFHSLRHTGITFVARHHDIWVAQKWADHSTPTLTARYAHVHEEDLDRAVSALPLVAAALDKPGSNKAR